MRQSHTDRQPHGSRPPSGQQPTVCPASTRAPPGLGSGAGAGLAADGGGAMRGRAVGGEGSERVHAVIGSGLSKGRYPRPVMRARIGPRRRRAWSCEVSSGRCKTPGAAANGLQMLLGRGAKSALVPLCVRAGESSATATRRGMAATGTAAAEAAGKLLVLLLLGLTAPAAALAGYIEVRTGRAPERRLLRPPGSAACGRSWVRGWGRGARFGAAAGCLPQPPACAPQLCAELSAEVGLPPPPPQRPNERRRGCGAAPAPYPPAAPPHPRGHRTARPPSLGTVCASAVRLRGALNGGGRLARHPWSPQRSRGRGSHLAAGAQPWSARWTWRWGCGSSPGERPRCRGSRVRRCRRDSGALCALPRSQPFAQVWQTREPSFPAPANVESLGKGTRQYIGKALQGYFLPRVALHQRSPLLTSLLALVEWPGSLVVGGSSGRWKRRVWNRYCGVLCT